MVHARWRKYKSGKTKGKYGDWNGLIMYDDELGNAHVRYELTTTDLAFISTFVDGTCIHVVSAEIGPVASAIFDDAKKKIEGYAEGELALSDIKEYLHEEYPAVDETWEFSKLMHLSSYSYGKINGPVLDHIEIICNRTTQELRSDGLESSFRPTGNTVNLKDRLVMDRHTETFEFGTESSSGISTTYKSTGDPLVLSVLDALRPLSLEARLQYSTEDAGSLILDKDDIRTYRLRARWSDGALTELEGPFGAGYLPMGFPDIALGASFIMNIRQLCMMLDENAYMKPYRMKDQVIICGVVFKEDGDEHFFKTYDPSYDPGDYVVVPSYGNRNRTALITSMLACSESEPDAELGVKGEIIRRANSHEIERFNDPSLKL